MRLQKKAKKFRIKISDTFYQFKVSQFLLFELLLAVISNLLIQEIQKKYKIRLLILNY